MKITIGIPTYNRKETLEIMANSLYASDLSVKPNIKVYDDKSTTIDKAFLKQLFPDAVSITVNSENLKSDKNIFSVYQDFLNSDDDYFFNADSDIIFHPNWLSLALKHIENTDGILTLFNANSHEAYTKVDDVFCLKKHIGAAGTLFTRERVAQILEHFKRADDVKNFDWQWCAYFQQKGIRIFCLNDSLVQHIGYNGQNSNSYFDVGLGYKVQTATQGQIINDVLVKSISNIRLKAQKRDHEHQINNANLSNDFLFHFKKCLLIIVKKILTKKVYKSLKAKLK